MIDGIHYRETRAIRPHPEEPRSCPFSSVLPVHPRTPSARRSSNATNLPFNPFFSTCIHLTLVAAVVYFSFSAGSLRPRRKPRLMHLLAYRYNCRAIIRAGLPSRRPSRDHLLPRPLCSLSLSFFPYHRRLRPSFSDRRVSRSFSVPSSLQVDDERSGRTPFDVRFGEIDEWRVPRNSRDLRETN